MDQTHRKIIKRNIVTLSRDMNFTDVATGLLARDIFERHHIEKFQSKPSTRDQNLALLMDIETRGPRAFSSLIESLIEANQPDLAEKLGYETSNSQSQPAPGPFGQPSTQPQPAWPARDSTGDYSTTQMDAMNSYPQSMVDSDNVYKMKSRPRGLALIINNKNFKTMKKRTGTDVDCRNLENVFKQLGFNVIVNRDLKGREIQQMLDQLRKHNHSQFDCFIFAVLTHGIEGAIYGTDEYLVKIEDIVAQFSSDRCPTLNGKPKLFFLQACRGEKFDDGVEATDGVAVAPESPTEEGDAKPQVDAKVDDDKLIQMMLKMELDSTDSFASTRTKMPNQSDMLLAYATVPGFVSWRNSERGSWFIQALTEVFLTHARQEDLLSMITMVNSKVARAFESSSGRHKQMPAPVTMLTKKLYFFPGHYE